MIGLLVSYLLKRIYFNRWRMPMLKHQNRIRSHVKDHIMIYIFMIVLFITGIIFGAITVNSMTFIQKQDLFFHLDKYMTQVHSEDTVHSKDILKRSFFFHFKYLALFFLLGITIIGVPAIWLLLFIKGVVIGFSVGFIVNQLGLKGLLLATLSIAPQNLLTIPIYIFASSLAMIFSLTLWYKLVGRTVTRSLKQPFLQYSYIFIILVIGALGSSLIETFVANEAFKALLKTSIYSILILI